MYTYWISTEHKTVKEKNKNQRDKTDTRKKWTVLMTFAHENALWGRAMAKYINRRGKRNDYFCDFSPSLSLSLEMLHVIHSR